MWFEERGDLPRKFFEALRTSFVQSERISLPVGGGASARRKEAYRLSPISVSLLKSAGSLLSGSWKGDSCASRREHFKKRNRRRRQRKGEAWTERDDFLVGGGGSKKEKKPPRSQER